jgi:hypothetical protein
MSTQCNGWQTSSFSDNGPNCVEVLFLVETDGGVVAQVRNSRHPEGPVLVFDRAEWEAFELGVFNHEFQMPH